MRAIGIGILIAAAFPGSASAQQKDDERDLVALKPLLDCRAIAAPDAQLECFRAATAALEDKVRQRQVRIVNRQDIRKASRSLFGFTLPRIDLFSGDRNEEQVTQVDTTITSVRPLANGYLQFKVAEGDAEWATTEPLPYMPRVGTKVRIKKGPLGSYFIAIDGEPRVRGTRVR